MDPAVLALLTALCSGIAGIITATASIISANKRGDDECLAKLTTVRKEAEDSAHELHKLKMEKFTSEPEVKP